MAGVRDGVEKYLLPLRRTATGQERTKYAHNQTLDFD